MVTSLNLMLQESLFTVAGMLLFMSNSNKINYYSNNTVDINVFECVEKEKFAFDKVETGNALTIESDSRFDKEAALYAVKKVLKKK